MMPATKNAILCAASVAALVLSGCAYPIAAVLVASGDGGGGGGGKKNVAPPSVAIAGVEPAPARRLVSVTVQVEDLDNTDIVLEVDNASPLGNPPSFVPAASASVAGGPDPTAVVLQFDSTGFLGFGNFPSVPIRVTATDTFGATDEEVLSIAVANDEAPDVELVSIGTASGLASVDGRVPITFAVIDEDSDEIGTDASNADFARADVKIEYSRDGGARFFDATGLVLRERGRTLGLESLAGLRGRATGESATDNVFTFVWDTFADGLSGMGPQDLIIRIRARSTGSSGLQGGSALSALRLGAEVALFGREVRTGFRFVNGVETGDLADVDGVPDVVVLASTNEVRLGTGLGDFPSATPAIALDLTLPVPAIGDVNGDGALDVVARRFSFDDELVAYLGPTFTSETVIAAIADPSFFPSELLLADFTSDGLPDLLVVEEDQTRLFPSIDGTTFGGAIITAEIDGDAMRPLPIDADRDGDLDLVVVAAGPDGELKLLLNQGSGSLFPAGSAGLGLGITPEGFDGANASAAAGDLDGDGIADLVVATQDLSAFGASRITVLRGTPSTSPFFEERASVFATILGDRLALVDVNGDGALDLVANLSDAGGAAVRLGNGDGTLAPVDGRLSGEGRTEPLRAIDANGDGVLDLLSLTDRDILVRFGTPGGSLGEEPVLPGRTLPIAAALADFDEDGYLDIAVASFGAFDVSTNDSALEVRRGEGGGAFGDPACVAGPGCALGPSDEHVVGVVAADVVGDARPDLITREISFPDIFVEPTALRTRVFETTDTGFVEAAAIDLAASGGEFNIFAPLVVGDFDGDDAPDIATFEGDGGPQVRVLVAFGGGAAPFSVTTAASLDSFARTLGAADLDGDGVDELVTQIKLASDEAIRILSVGADRDFDAADQVDQLIRPGEEWSAMLLADVTGDGLADLIAATRLFLSGAGSDFEFLTVRPGTGGKAFGPPIDLPARDEFESIAVADIDADGRKDIAASSQLGLSVYRARSGTTARAGHEGGSGGRGDGDGGTPRFVHEDVTLGSTLGVGPTHLALGDVNDDGIDDVLVLSVFEPSGVRMAISSAVRGSRPVPAAFGDAGARFVPVEDLVLPDGAASGGNRLVPASLAYAFVPETKPFAAGAVVALPLRSSLTAAQLAGSFRVFRQDPATDIVAEVTGAIFTVNADRGTLSFPIPAALEGLGYGRFQAFSEEPAEERVVLLRETFDATGPDSTRTAPLPPGWFGEASWMCGVPTPTAAVVPASAPNLLGIGMRRPYTDATDEFVRSAPFRIAGDPGADGKSLALRFLDARELGPTDTAAVFLVCRDPEYDNTITVPVAAFSTDAAMAAEAFDITATIAAARAGLNDLPERVSDKLGAGEPIEVRLEFRLTGNSPPGQGWFIDDVEVILSDP